MKLVKWTCKRCGAWWVHGTDEHETPPRRCYGECGGEEFERGEVLSNTASATPREDVA